MFKQASFKLAYFVIFLLYVNQTIAQTEIDKKITSNSILSAQELCRNSKIDHHRNLLVYRSTGNQDEFDINYYKIDLDVFPGSKKILGVVDIYSTCLKSGLKRLDFDFTESLMVEAVTTNGKNLLFEHDYDTKVLKVFLDKVYSKGEEIKVSIKYRGEPGGSFHFDNKFNKIMVWTKTEPYGSLDWFPCKNLPEDKADSVDLVITVPSGLVVASNGLLTSVDTLDNNKVKYTWEERYPIVTYLISLAIHPYTIRTDFFKYNDADSMPVVSYIVPDHFEDDNEKYAIVPDMLTAFSGYFGEYPFIKEKYGNAEFPWSGGMEHQTLTSLLGPYEFLLAHELAHQWWGDMITCKNFHHIWLNEGFATYSEALWEEYKNGLDAYHAKMNEKEYLGEGTIYVEDITTNPATIFDGNLSYKKASWVLHMLRHIVGEDKFFNILKSYARSAKRYGVATTDDFVFIAEKVSGKDLVQFFDQWIYGDFHPIYFYDWSYKQTDDKYELILNIEQFQTQNLFTLPIDISVVTEDGEETFVVDNFNKLQGYTFTLDSKPLEVTLDKDNWILKEVNEGISLVNHDNNEMTLSVSNSGSYGYFKPNGFGTGLVFPQEGENNLYFGSLMIGNSNEYVADISEIGSERDFKKLEGSSFEINGTSISNLDINIKYTDAGHPESKNILIDQTSYSWNIEPYRELIIFKFKVINRGDEDLDSFYLSQFMDFDIPDYTENYIDKDETKRLMYQSSDGIYCGVKLLNNYDKANYVAISSAVDFLNESKKFRYLTGEFNDFKKNKKDDWSTLLSVGPYSLNKGDTLIFDFAIVVGTSEANIKRNADHAQALFDKYLVSNKDIIKEKPGISVKVFPNPIQDKINLELHLDKPRELTLSLFDLSGKQLYSERRIYNQGNNYISINRPLRNGVYFYKIRTKSGILTGKVIK